MADAVADTEVAPAAPGDAATSAKEDGDAAAKAKASKPSKKDGKGDGKQGAKKGKAQDAAAGDGPNVAAHPRAARSIALTKSWCGLIGFLVAGYLSLPTGTLPGVGLRAVVAGVICYVAGWGASVFVWRRLVMLEIKAREQQLVSEVLARHAALSASGPSGQSGGQDAP